LKYVGEFLFRRFYFLGAPVGNEFSQSRCTSAETLFSMNTRVCPYNAFDAAPGAPQTNVGVSRLVDEGRDTQYFLAAASITSIKSELQVQKTVEWLVYHWLMGVQHFWIFCHEVCSALYIDHKRCAVHYT
jgi:hypothetical protein